MYGQSSLAAWRVLCRSPRSPAALCPAIADTASLAAAGELRDSSPPATPERARSPRGPHGRQGRHDHRQHDEHRDPALGHARDGQPGLRTAGRAPCARHRRPAGAARRVHRSRPCTSNRATGRILSRRHPPGHLRTAAPGRAGRAGPCTGSPSAAAELHEPGPARVAQHLAGYVSGRPARRRRPAMGLRRSAGGAASMSSAGVITAAGLLHLAAACRYSGACAAPPLGLAGRRDALHSPARGSRDTPPLGFLGSQDLDGRRRLAAATARS